MSVIKAGPAVPAWLAAGLVGVLIGGVGGWYGAHWGDPEKPGGAGRPPGGGGGMGAMMGGGGGGMGGMMGGGGMGGMGGGMGGGGGAQAHPNAAALVRTVSSLAVLEKARGQELTDDQRAKLAKAVEPLAAGGKMSEADCEARIKEINAILKPAQVTAVDDLLPRPGGGRGGAGGPGAGGPPSGGAPSGPAAASRPAGANGPGSPPGMGRPRGPSGGGMGGMMGGGMGGMMGGGGGGFGGGMDYEQPFKEGRGKDRLTELLASLKK